MELSSSRVLQAAKPFQPISPSTPLFQVLSLQELAALPRPEWLVQQHLVAGSLAVLYGKPGSGKSFLALDISLSIASGIPWGGLTSKEGMVLYVAGEGHGGLLQRVEAWCCQHEIPLPSNIRVLPGRVNLLHAEDVEGLLQGIRDMPTLPILIIFDTLSRCMVGGDENGNRDMGLIVSHLDCLREATGACILVIHHTVKSGKEERGSTVLRGAADTMLQLTTTSTFGRVVLSCEKQKDGTPFKTTEWQLTQVGESCVPILQENTLEFKRSKEKSHPPLSGNQQRIHDLLANFPKGLSQAEIKEATDLAPSSISDSLRVLQEKGRVIFNKTTKIFTLTLSAFDSVGSPLKGGNPNRIPELSPGSESGFRSEPNTRIPSQDGTLNPIEESSNSDRFSVEPSCGYGSEIRIPETEQLHPEMRETYWEETI